MRFLIILSLLLPKIISAQDFDWWVHKHNWDGHTHWTQYMTITQKYFGPNALPVPEIKTGKIQEELNLRAFGEFHYSKGDKTADQFTYLFVPLANNIGVEINVVPLEYYVMDTITRDLRAARDKDGKGFSGGDIYFGTHIQLLRETEQHPGVLFTVNLKTASGTNLQGARFTDTPGYFMDVSSGMRVYENDHAVHRFFAQAGFYSYQTYIPEHAQNDAFTYGLGYSIDHPKYQLTGSYGGYIGYINNGDRPMIARAQIILKSKRQINFMAQIQQGILQYQYTSLRAGIVWRVPIKLNRGV